MTQSGLFGNDPQGLRREIDEMYTSETVIAVARCGCVLGASLVPKSTNTSAMREHVRDVARWQKNRELTVSTVNHKDIPVIIGGCDRCRE